MARYRLSRAAQEDIIDILTWSHTRFGEDARRRYEALIVAAIRDVGAGRSGTARPELGAGVFSWHLRRSRDHSGAPGVVHRPRHFLIYRIDADVVVIGRVLHDAMELRRHVTGEDTWA